MINPISPTPPGDPIKEVSSSHLKVPDSFQKAGFTEDDYKKFYDTFLRTLSQEMDKVTNKLIKALKEQRRKIESGE